MRLRQERGQALVEFALVLPLFATLLFAIIQFGIVLNHYLVLVDAVRAGARQASVSRLDPDPAGKTVAAVRSAGSGLDGTQLGVTVTSTWQRGSGVTVAGSYPYAIDVLGVVVKSGNLTSSTTEAVE
jgi:Flp pilus assembly protein TadG